MEETTQNTQEVTLPAECSHPELATCAPIQLQELIYQCTACRKKIAIPRSQFIEWRDEEDAIAGIIGLAFGEKWGKQVKR